ncbi:ATP-dependent DNA ligase [Streptomyces sp. NBC_01233]|uniref:ATP-dependent DNA ligase n=1 Tax=Streptomyces sp. NBC_01233 TaxID=2903787 RepID=UPI002E0F6F21|nr:hypothetical protein OG332_47190 [Streptomyces sp. NBC_01233]
MLAQARDMVPAPGALPGELRFQQKFDGCRAIVFTPWPAPGLLLVQSRRGSLLHSRFPDLVAAAADLPDGPVLDGELIVWAEGQMPFEALQRRAVSGGRTAARLAAEASAHFIVFDILQIDGQELLHIPYGTVRGPQTLVLGRLDETGALRPVGRSTQLRPDAARDLAERLTLAWPGHPWEGVRFTTSWGSRTPLEVVLVDPTQVAEIMVDTALRTQSSHREANPAR